MGVIGTILQTNIQQRERFLQASELPSSCAHLKEHLGLLPRVANARQEIRFPEGCVAAFRWWSPCVGRRLAPAPTLYVVNRLLGIDGTAWASFSRCEAPLQNGVSTFGSNAFIPESELRCHRFTSRGNRAPVTVDLRRVVRQSPRARNSRTERYCLLYETLR